MAARKNRGVGSLPEEWKDKIKATQIMNRLEKCLNGEVELTAQQIKAADIILKKIVPDLGRVEHTGDEEAPIHHDHKVTVELIKPNANPDTGGV
jgi:hypothetical protein